MQSKSSKNVFIVSDRPVFASRQSSRSSTKTPKRVVSPKGIQPVIEMGFEITPQFEEVLPLTDTE